MNYELLGFIKAGKHREEIIKLLNNKLLTPTEISFKLKLHNSQVSRDLSGLAEKGLIKVMTPSLTKGKLYSITVLGMECLKNLGE